MKTLVKYFKDKLINLFTHFLLFSINSFFFKYKFLKLSEPEFKIVFSLDVKIDEDSFNCVVVVGCLQEEQIKYHRHNLLLLTDLMMISHCHHYCHLIPLTHLSPYQM